MHIYRPPQIAASEKDNSKEILLMGGIAGSFDSRFEKHKPIYFPGAQHPYHLIRGRTSYTDGASQDDTNIEMRLKKYDFIKGATGQTLFGDMVFRDVSGSEYDMFRIRQLSPEVHGVYRLLKPASKRTGILEIPASAYDLDILDKHLKHFVPHKRQLPKLPIAK